MFKINFFAWLFPVSPKTFWFLRNKNSQLDEPVVLLEEEIILMLSKNQKFGGTPKKVQKKTEFEIFSKIQQNMYIRLDRFYIRGHLRSSEAVFYLKLEKITEEANFGSISLNRKCSFIPK